jgi:nucleoside-diphosphate-sugar epimerase
MERIFKKEKPTVVNHQTAIAEVVVSVRDPIPTLTTNVLGTANLAALTKGKNVTTNIGRGILTTDKEICDAIAHEMHFAPAPIYAPFRPGEIFRVSLDATKARKLLGWKPKVGLEEGIHRALAPNKN